MQRGLSVSVMLGVTPRNLYSPIASVPNSSNSFFTTTLNSVAASIPSAENNNSSSTNNNDSSKSASSINNNNSHNSSNSNNNNNNTQSATTPVNPALSNIKQATQIAGDHLLNTTKQYRSSLATVQLLPDAIWRAQVARNTKKVQRKKNLGSFTNSNFFNFSCFCCHWVLYHLLKNFRL